MALRLKIALVSRHLFSPVQLLSRSCLRALMTANVEYSPGLTPSTAASNPQRLIPNPTASFSPSATVLKHNRLLSLCPLPVHAYLIHQPSFSIFVKTAIRQLCTSWEWGANFQLITIIPPLVANPLDSETNPKATQQPSANFSHF